MIGSAGLGPPASLAEQLKQVLAERERRLASGSSPPHPDPVQLTNDLVDEIRQAVSEANARGLYTTTARILRNCADEGQ